MSSTRQDIPTESAALVPRPRSFGRRWWWVGIVAVALSSAVAGVFVSYPSPHQIVERMWPVRTKLLGALRRDARDEALEHVERWERLVTKLPVARLLHGDSPAASARARIAALEESLAALREALVNGQAEQIRPTAIACLEIHRECAAAYRDVPPMVHEPAGEGHKHALREVGPDETAPTVAMSVQPDSKSGWNIHVETTQFRFAPEHANEEHVPGEGHAHLYVDGKKVTRLYDDWYYLPSLPPGRHAIRVTLNTNDHYDYAVDGVSIAAETTIEVGNDLELVYFGTRSDSATSAGLVDPAADDICRQPSGLPLTTTQSSRTIED